MLTWAKSESKFRALEEGQKLNQSLVVNILFYRQRQEVQLVISEAKNENWQVCV